eukprot:6319587-Amphidinium_carterae.1
MIFWLPFLSNHPITQYHGIVSFVSKTPVRAWYTFALVSSANSSRSITRVIFPCLHACPSLLQIPIACACVGATGVMWTHSLVRSSPPQLLHPQPPPGPPAMMPERWKSAMFVSVVW